MHSMVLCSTPRYVALYLNGTQMCVYSIIIIFDKDLAPIQYQAIIYMKTVEQSMSSLQANLDIMVH